MFLTKTKLALVTFACLLVNSSGTIHAQQPDGIIRTFMIVDLVNENVDFGDEDSVLLKVENDLNSISTKTFFTDPNHPLSAFSGETFGFGASAMYVTRSFGDTPVGVFAWLLDVDTPEPPPVGSVAFLGPDVVILQTQTFNVYTDQNFIYPTPDESASRATIVTALFTR